MEYVKESDGNSEESESLVEGDIVEIETELF